MPLAVDLAGTSDRVVVLLHGVGGSRAIWSTTGSDTLQALAEAGFQALAVDLPGYGQSAHIPFTTLADMAQQVMQELESRRVNRFSLLGHSMGGMVAQEIAWRWPSCVEAMVLACTSSAFGRSDGSWQQAFVRERLSPLEAGLGMHDVAQRLVPGLLGPHAPEHAMHTALSLMAAVPAATYRRAVQALSQFDVRAQLAQMTMPILCLAAEHDRTSAPELMQRMAQRLPSAEYACLPQAGHIANLEVPHAFNALVTDFIRRHCVSRPHDV